MWPNPQFPAENFTFCAVREIYFTSNDSQVKKFTYVYFLEKIFTTILIQITAQKMKFSIKDFFSKCDQIRRKLRIWTNLLKKPWMENLIFPVIKLTSCLARFIFQIRRDISIKRRGGSRTAATFKMERFLIIVNDFQLITIVTKRSILDVAAVLDPALKSITTLLILKCQIVLQNVTLWWNMRTTFKKMD